MQSSTCQGKEGMVNEGWYITVNESMANEGYYLSLKEKHGQCRIVPSRESKAWLI